MASLDYFLPGEGVPRLFWFSVAVPILILAGCSTATPQVAPSPTVLPPTPTPQPTPTFTPAATTQPSSTTERGELGSRLAYLDSDGVLWVINADGSGLLRVGDQCADAWGLSWSTRGDALVCGLAGGPSPAPSLLVVDLAGNILAEIDDARGIGQASSWSPVAIWSPDGQRIAYHASDGSLKIANLADGTSTALNPDALPLAWPLPNRLIGGLNPQPIYVWSPDRAPVLSHIDEDPPGRSGRARLLAERLLLYTYETYWLDIITGGMEPIPRLDSPRQFWFSPDGTKAVLLADEYIPERNGFPLVVYDLTTGEEWEILDSAISYPADRIPNDQLAISVDSTTVYWANSIDGPNTNIYRAQIDGSVLALLGVVPPYRAAVSQEGVIAFIELDADNNATIVMKDFPSDKSAEIPMGKWSGRMAWFTPPAAE